MVEWVAAASGVVASGASMHFGAHFRALPICAVRLHALVTVTVQHVNYVPGVSMARVESRRADIAVAAVKGVEPTRDRPR